MDDHTPARNVASAPTNAATPSIHHHIEAVKNAAKSASDSMRTGYVNSDYDEVVAAMKDLNSILAATGRDAALISNLAFESCECDLAQAYEKLSKLEKEYDDLRFKDLWDAQDAAQTAYVWKNLFKEELDKARVKVDEAGLEANRCKFRCELMEKEVVAAKNGKSAAEKLLEEARAEIVALQSQLNEAKLQQVGLAEE